MSRLAAEARSAGVLAVLAFLAACSGGSPRREAHADATGKRLSARGVRVALPPGWDGRITARRWPLPDAATVSLASFPLASGDDTAASRARKAMGRNDVLLVLSETLPARGAPAEQPRIDPRERRASVDRYVIASGRAFVLRASFGSRPPPRKLIERVNAVLARLAIGACRQPLKPAPDPAPASALAPARLLPTPIRILTQCRLAQARSPFPILCPARLPRPFLSWPRAEPPRPAAERLPAPGTSWRSRSDPRYRQRSFGGVSIGYGAPWEPDSGRDWRLHLWRNRPCCFLHFEVFWRREGGRHVPAGARPAKLGGRRGLLKDASSYALVSRDNDHLYFPNHPRFLWREKDIPYVATLHRFGTKRETRALLARLIRELRPVRELRSRCVPGLTSLGKLAASPELKRCSVPAGAPAHPVHVESAVSHRGEWNLRRRIGAGRRIRSSWEGAVERRPGTRYGICSPLAVAELRPDAFRERDGAGGRTRPECRTARDHAGRRDSRRLGDNPCRSCRGRGTAG